MRNSREQSKQLKPREVSDVLGKLPPQAIEVEESVLAGILLEKSAMAVALATSLKPEHFYDERHSLIYKSCLDLFSQAIPIDMRTIVKQLKTNGHIELIGGMVYIVEVTTKSSSAANIESHIRILQELYMKRMMITIASELQRDAYDDTISIFDLMETAATKIYHLDIGKSTQRKILDMVTLLNETIQNLQTKTTNNGLTGIASGFSLLDRITSGWQNSDLILIAARPGAGKSAMMLSLARYAARTIPVAIFSLEMSAIQLAERLISSDNSIENDKIRSGLLSEIEWQRIGSDPNKLSAAQLYIDDTPSISVNELRSKCMRLKQDKGLKMIIIDYLQLMKGDQGGNREQEIASISRALKNLAKELNVPVIALSQLSRAVEQRADKRPMLSDLRESGSLEQDPDMVIFLYRPEYYKIYQDENGMSTAGICEVDVAKHRSGGTGMVKVRFQKYFTRFVDLESDFEPNGTKPLFPQTERISTQVYDPSEARNKKDDDAPF